jgi:hypothetical protein
MDRAIYCLQHGISVKTFGRWMNHLISKEEARKHTEYLLELRREERRLQLGKKGKRRQKRRYAVSTDIRSRAIQAFWAMHVEAMNWSGMGVREYAASFQLSPTSLRKWRDRIENAEVEIDWRAHLHPSTRPADGISARQFAAESSLTAPSNDVPQAPTTPARRFFRTNRSSRSRWKAGSRERRSPALRASTGSSRGSCSAGAYSSAWRKRNVRSLRPLRSLMTWLRPPFRVILCNLPRE